MLVKNELQSIISGTGHVTKGNAIQAVANHLRKGKAAGSVSEEEEHIKEKEAAAIIDYCRQNDFLHPPINKDRYLTEGAEQKVYLEEDGLHVLKLNDSIFYQTWQDYLNSLLLHNYFFPATSYELTGFLQENETLYAVVKQVYIHTSERTDETLVKELMAANGFENKKNSDYFNKELGLILEDLHDENVLTCGGVQFYVDTVFYLTKAFWV